MNSFITQSPAKINLFLKVVGKRANGYHEIISLMSRIDLFDVLTLSFEQPSITIRCSNPRVPEGKNNLAYKAASLFFEALPSSNGVDVWIEKVIPVAAGLGGGSSNAASVLMALNQHYALPFSNMKLMEMGQKIGADVPFFLLRHSAIVSGIGEKLEKFQGMPPLSAVLVCPNIEVSTKWVYESLTLPLTKSGKNFIIQNFREDPFRMLKSLSNDLEEVTVARFPEINNIKQRLLELGAQVASMSGSGPSVFGLFEDLEKASMAFQTMKHRECGDIFLVSLLLP